MPRPAKLPEWASSLANVLEPSAGKKAAGWLNGEQPPAGYFNWIASTVYSWLLWLGGIREMQEISALLNTVRVATGGTGIFNAFAISDSGIIVGVGAAGKVYNSQSQGLTWNASSVGSSYVGDFFDVIWTGTAFIAVGAAGEIQRSTNGTSFSRITNAPAVNLTGIARTASGAIIVIGATGKAYKSTDDGLTFPTTLTNINGGTYTSYSAGAQLVESGGVFVACGNTGSLTTNVQRSTGGDFAAVNLSTVLAAGTFVAEVFVRPGGGFYARATDAASTQQILLQSSDGLTWTVVSTVSPTASDYRLVASSAIVALLPTVATNPVAYVSVDGGATWRTQMVRAIVTPVRMQLLEANNTRVFVSGNATAGLVLLSQFLSAPI